MIGPARDAPGIQGKMLMRRSLAVLAVSLFLSVTHAHDAPARYLVTELRAPAALTANCQQGFLAGAYATRVNDFGVMNGVYNCFTAVDIPTNTVQQQGATFVASPWFRSRELPRSNGGSSYSYHLNNRGEIFGYETGPAETGGLFATRWTIGGGHERLFYDPSCEGIQFQSATDGNGRYIVGWALRGDPSLPPPVDQLCIKTRWVIRNAAGVESSGPLGGTPTALNSHDVAVGTVDSSAVRYHVPTGQLTVLHAATATESLEANDINDLGDVVGRILTNSSPYGYNQCDRGVALRWDRQGREQVLPHLPGAVSSRAYGVGYRGEAVGDSGAGIYCGWTDNSSERAVLWKNGRVYDLNSLIPRNAGITLTYAFSVNRLGQISAGGYSNKEPLGLCPVIENGNAISTVPCRNQHMYLLTPLGF